MEVDYSTKSDPVSFKFKKHGKPKCCHSKMLIKSKKYAYKLLDETKFLNELGKFVDGSLRVNDFYFGNYPTTSFEFIGQVKWGAFEIFGVKKFLLFGHSLWHILLKIEGVVTHNHLSFDISYPKLFSVILNVIVLSFIGVLLIVKNQVLAGVLLMLVNIVQAIWSWRNAMVKREEFLENISNIESVEVCDA
jgi:hypothetical protein